MLPIDRIQHPEHKLGEPAPSVSYAFAVGLVGTLLGELVSIVVPGRGFLVVWACVAVAVSVGAGWYADRVREAAHRLLAHTPRTR